VSRIRESAAEGCQASARGITTTVITETDTLTQPQAVDISPAARRGPLSSWVVDRLYGGGGSSPTQLSNPLSDDAQTALYLCYETHFGELAPHFDAEWDPRLIEFRRRLEHAFETRLRQLGGQVGDGVDHHNVVDRITDLIVGDDGPSLSRHMEAQGTIEQMQQFVRHRSPYQLKEADGHTFGIPRLRRQAKQRLAEIQAGEYGADEPGRMMHSELFAQTMETLGLDSRPNAYLASLPASSLAVSNLISMFGLNRRLRSAMVGHLAVFEMTSVEPMGRYARGLRRLGVDERAVKFYDVHVLADAEHEVLVAEMAQAHLLDEPGAGGEVMFGAASVLQIERWFAGDLLADWKSNQQSHSRTESAA
jgi:hypothetical protein